MASDVEPARIYRIHQRLGRGGMGEVLLGTMVTPAGERRVAIKRVLLREDSPRGTDAVARIIEEARLVFQLTHANICQVIDLAVSERETFIVMEYVDGCDLKTLVRLHRKRKESLPTAAAVYALREVARGLDYAHRRRDESGRPLFLMHGDVTPQNVLLSREGEVKLADFGIARALGVQAPGNQLYGGTPGYIAPESERGEPDQRSDVFGAGVTLYAALSERSPEHGIDLAALMSGRTDVPRALIELLRRAVASRVADRFSSAAELEESLTLFLARHHPAFGASAFGRLVGAVANSEAEPESTEMTLVRSQMGTASLIEVKAPTHRAGGTVDLKRRRGGRLRRYPVAAAVAFGALAIGGMTYGVRLTLLATAPVTTAERMADGSRATEFQVPAVPEPGNGLSSPTSKTATARPSVRVTPDEPRADRARTAIHGEKKIVAAHASSLGRLSVYAEPWGVVMVDGHRFADSTPTYQAPLAAGKHRVWVTSPELKRSSRVETILVVPGEAKSLVFKW